MRAVVTVDHLEQGILSARDGGFAESGFAVLPYSKVRHLSWTLPVPLDQGRT
jgi:hypothetical protein